MSDPQIIQSGKPHTVSLPEGSTVAAHKRPRMAGGQLPEPPPLAELRLGDIPDELELAQATARTAPPQATARHAPAAAAAARGARARPPAGLDPALLARIADLERRNDQVRGTLQRVGAAPANPGEPT